MALLRIKIVDYKSYSSVELQDFGLLNTLVGKNGSGKSSLLDAIEFCLTDRYVRLNEAQRRQFLPNIAGQPVNPESSVEVELDNSNTPKRFSIATPTVTFRRRMTLQADQYFINGKPIKFEDYMGFLDNAGFWASDSYFCVRHQSVETIVKSEPKTLLDIVRKMFGQKNFDQKKRKAMDSLDSARTLLQENELKIDDACQHLHMYKFSSKDIKDFKKLTKQQQFLRGRSAHFQLEAYEKERQVIEETMQELHEQKDEVGEEFEASKRLADESNRKLDRNRKELDRLQNHNEASCLRLKETRKAISDLKQKILKCQLLDESVEQSSLDEIDERIDDLKARKVEYEEMIVDLRKKKQKCNQQLHRMMPQIDKHILKDKYGNLSRKQLSKLYRDKIGEVQDQIKAAQEKMATVNEQIAIFRQRANSIKAWMDNKLATPDYEEMKALKLRICKTESELKALERQIKPLLGECLEMNEHVFKARYSASFPPDMDRLTMMQSLNFLRNPMNRLKVEIEHAVMENQFDNEQQKSDYELIYNGFYGQIADHLVLPPTVHRTLEALLGEKIFAYVVKNEEVQMKILELIKARGFKVPEIRFLAMDGISLEHDELGDSNANCQPFVALLDLSGVEGPEMKEAIHYICQKKYIVKDIDVAVELSKQYKDCSFGTVEGRAWKPNGRRTIVNTECKTKFELFKEKKASNQETERLHIESVEKEELLMNLEERMKTLIATRRRDLKEAEEFNQREIDLHTVGKLFNGKIETIEKIIREQEKLAGDYEAEIIKLVGDKDFWETFHNDGDKFEEYDLNALSEALKLYKDMRKIKDGHKNDGKKAKSYLVETNNEIEMLKMKRKNIEGQLIELEMNQLLKQEGETELLNLTEEAEEYRRQIEQVSEQIANLKANIELLNTECKDFAKKFDAQKLVMDELNEKIRQSLLLLEECKQRLQLADDEIQKSAYRHGFRFAGIPDEYFNANASETVSLLRNLDKKLQKISTELVNSETVRLSEGIHQDLENLKDSRQKQAVVVAEILELIERIVSKRSEIILRNIKQLGVYFEAYFKHFVKDGRSKITLTVRDEEEDDSSDSQSTSIQSLSQASRNILNRIDKNDPLEDNFSHLDILVAFDGTENYQKMESLSGGQRTIIALAFVFAVQSILNLPFHLFDEVDRNLDLANRNLLASFIDKQVRDKKVQYIMATHNTEIVNISDNVYNITISAGVSKVQLEEPMDAGSASSTT